MIARSPGGLPALLAGLTLLGLGLGGCVATTVAGATLGVAGAAAKTTAKVTGKVALATAKVTVHAAGQALKKPRADEATNSVAKPPE
jgi:hypothetical protein